MIMKFLLGFYIVSVTNINKQILIWFEKVAFQV